MGLTELTRDIERRLTGDHNVVQHTTCVAVWCEYDDAAMVANMAPEYGAKIQRVEDSSDIPVAFEGDIHITLIEK